MATAAGLQVKDRIFIGGEWVEPSGGETIEVVNPTTEEAIGTITACSPEDADRAVAAASEAFDELVADFARGARRIHRCDRRGP